MMTKVVTVVTLMLLIATVLGTTMNAYAQSAANGAEASPGASVSTTNEAVTPDGSWHRFQFLDTGSFGTAGGGCPSIAPAFLCAPNPPWTFDCANTSLICWLTVTDGFELGDEFEIFDFGSSVGTTSAVVPNGSCGADPDACLAAGFSSAMIDLGPGAHSITIQVTDTPFGGGAAFFKMEIHAVVGGEFLPIDSTALLLAGVQSSAIWMLPVLAGVAGSAFGVLYIKSRRN